MWNFDLQGRVTTRTDAITGGGTFATGWTYDAMSRVRTMTYPDGEQVATTYNAQGLPATLGTYITASSYNAASQLTSLTFGNNVVTTNYTYHAQNLRLTNLGSSDFDVENAIVLPRASSGKMNPSHPSRSPDARAFPFDPIVRVAQRACH